MQLNSKIQNQFYNFYRTYFKNICQTINNGEVLIFVGINASGKNILVDQILTDRFRIEFLRKRKTYFVHLSFKDKYIPSANQLYRYWTDQTVKTLGCNSLDEKTEYNDFFFYSQISDLIRRVKPDERIVFILQDVQNILTQKEPFFKSLTYFHQFSEGKVSYIILSEPQILDSPNPWVRLFVQHFTGNNFIFLKHFDKETVIADIRQHEMMLQRKLDKYESLIIKYSKGLHGVIGAFCRLLKDNPKIRNIKQLMKIAYDDKLCRYWVTEVLDSLPGESVRILKEVSIHKNNFLKYRKNIYAKWLVNLRFLKPNGKLSYPLILPIIKDYSKQSLNATESLRLDKNLFYFGRMQMDLTVKEYQVLRHLFKFKGKLVTYDGIGEIIWKNNSEKFSLWAISQIIRRIRKKFALYNIHPQTLSSERGKGYILN